MTNNSPWIKQLGRTRPIAALPDNLKIDVAIIGGGIAGIATAYFILKNTSKTVAVLEAGKVAHGATGHNAGQIVSYFERQFSGLVKDFGLDMASRAQEAIDSAWILLEEIFEDAKLQTHFSQFTGYGGISDMDELLLHLQNRKYAIEAGLNSEHLLVAKEWLSKQEIPGEFEGLYATISHKDLLDRLETPDKSYIAAVSTRKGCMNSALFTEELLGYILSTYEERFVLAEHASVQRVVLAEDNAEIIVENKVVVAKSVVLCTNGFEKIELLNKVGDDVDTRFHQMVIGAVGYMAGFLEDMGRAPTAISYLPNHSDKDKRNDIYFYMTRRPFEDEKREEHNLVCMGGPETVLADTTSYSRETHEYPEQAQKDIGSFLRKTYRSAPAGGIEYKYRWHGLMGYTPSGVRCIGFEPKNKVLLYNLGCNGVGILPSIYGARRISLLLSGTKLEKSIFDPQEKLPQPFWERQN